MTYTTEEKNQAATALCALFPNLHFGVARTWVTCESGANNDVFGLTVGGKLQKYKTMEAGVKAAAKVLRSSKAYAEVVAAFDSPHPSSHLDTSHGVHASRQAAALCHSPWHSGATGLREQGGVDRYYARIFRENGYVVSPR